MFFTFFLCTIYIVVIRVGVIMLTYRQWVWCYWKQAAVKDTKPFQKFLNNEKVRKATFFVDQACVFMVREIVKKCKQSLSYILSTNAMKTADIKMMVKETIKSLRNIGLKVVATVCDQGSTKCAALQQLNWWMIIEKHSLKGIVNSEKKGSWLTKI